MKTYTKTEIRNNAAKAVKLLRGIDNEAASISKAQTALTKRVSVVTNNVAQVNSLLEGISSAALTATTPPAKPSKVKSVKAEKVKPVKAAKPAKETKVKIIKAAKVSSDKSTARLPVKDVIDTILNASSTPLTAAAIYTSATNGAQPGEPGYFSRQSLYSALKDAKYTRTGDGASATFMLAPTNSLPSDEEIDNFINKSTTNPVTSAVS